MDFAGFFRDATVGSLKSVAQVAAIVIPLMVAMEFLRHWRILDAVAGFFAPAMRFLGMSRQASLPLVVGLVFGIAYGSGVIIQSAREGELNKKDLYLLNTFLSFCHAMIEDTALFVAIGASGLFLVLSRFGLAIAATLIAAKLFFAGRRRAFLARETRP